MTQEEFDKAPKVERILYDKTGMLAKNHTDIIDAMTEYAESEVKKLNIFNVSQQRELLVALADNFNESTHTYVGQPMIEETLKAFNCG